MKKLVATMLIMVIALGTILCGCGKKADEEITEPTSEVVTEQVVTTEPTTEETTQETTTKKTKEASSKKQTSSSSVTTTKPQTQSSATVTPASNNANIINGVDITKGSKVDMSKTNNLDDVNLKNIINAVVNINMTQLEAVVAINKYICDNYEYDYSSSGNIAFLDFLAKKKGQCGEYSFLFQLMCSNCGIKTEIIQGTADNGQYSGGHGWNSVIIDGTTYYVDVTWNDTTRQTTKYLLIKDSTFGGTHTAW